MTLEIGMSATLTHTVGEADLATSWKNDVPVLATPILLWLAELAAMRAVQGALEPGRMTLGHGHRVEHLAPTPAGWDVHIEATLVAIEGRILTFDITATDGVDTVLSGSHTRALVGRDRFVARVAEKAEAALAPA